MKKPVILLSIVIFSFMTLSACETRIKDDSAEKVKSTIESEQTYTSDEYKFSMKYPADWFFNQDNWSFSNTKVPCGKETCGKDFLAFIFSVGEITDYGMLDMRKSAEQNATDKEKITSADGKVIDFFIHRQRPDDDPGYSYPMAQAFYVGDKNVYIFEIATEIPSGTAGQEKEIEILRESLKSLKFAE